MSSSLNFTNLELVGHFENKSKLEGIPECIPPHAFRQ